MPLAGSLYRADQGRNGAWSTFPAGAALKATTLGVALALAGCDGAWLSAGNPEPPTESAEQRPKHEGQPPLHVATVPLRTGNEEDLSDGPSPGRALVVPAGERKDGAVRLRGQSEKTNKALEPVATTSPPVLASKDHEVRASQVPGKLAEVAVAQAEPLHGIAPSPAPVPSHSIPRAPVEPLDRENYQHQAENPVKLVSEHPVSTFSIDVDTGAYANVRRFINSGRLPPRDAVRVEELVNYFDYAYAPPATRSQPFSVTTSLTRTPWHPERHLLRVGVQGYEMNREALPPANLVFLIDVSGSMRNPDKLPLLKSGLRLLTRQLRPQDRISIVAYAGGAGVVLAPTSGDQHAVIEQALDNLRSGGRTNGAAGIEAAYAMARQGFVTGGINRVLLATDGDFNVGVTGQEALEDLISRQRKSGISLTTLGFGTGNYNEALMEQLADLGNGNYAYVDSLKEANKVLVQQMSGTLATIAKDVKIQIEFNPAQVSEYRLIGYENRSLRREDFNNDRVDAGEIGAGHDVTALYELTLTDSASRRVDPLRYRQPSPAAGARAAPPSGELAFLRIRYKAPQGDTSKLLEWPLRRDNLERALASADEDFRFAAAVAGFGQLLRGGKYLGQFSYDDVLNLAGAARGVDRLGYRGEFLQLVALARTLASQAAAGGSPVPPNRPDRPVPLAGG